MANGPFEYDVAFSFLSVDEPLVVQVKNEIGSRLCVFFYTDEEKRNAFKDGELLLKEIYGQKARSVVVFYRQGWGDSSWTLIECDAIRDRAHDDGYDFVKLVKLDDAPRPKWLPRAHFYLGFSRWGAQGVAAVIESQIQELGGEPGEETALDRAARLAEARAFEKMRQEKLSSIVASDEVNKQVANLRKELNHIAHQITNAHADIGLRIEGESSRAIEINGVRGVLSIQCRYVEADRRIDATLRVDLKEYELFERKWNYHGSESLRLDVNRDGNYVWVDRERSSIQYNTRTLADYLIRRYLEWSHG